ncbi:hypothetical protein [Nocardia brasiliensis]|uniref:hypothetical protein n=1 Tax=Nocardia brasiliensis TaxID=37326 RepID=UPI002455D91A|nr:hypothetical protein [Nocardia brasiliensis]
MPAPKPLPPEWAKDMRAAGLVDEDGKPSRAALQAASALNPSQIHNAIYGSLTATGGVKDTTINALAKALRQSPEVIRTRIDKNLRVKVALTAAELDLLTWYRDLDADAQAREDQKVADSKKQAKP